MLAWSMDKRSTDVEEWTVVRSRKGKSRSSRADVQRNGCQQAVSCCVVGHSPNPRLASWDEEQKLQSRIQNSMERVRNSAFFRKFMKQLQGLEILETLIQNAQKRVGCEDARKRRGISEVEGGDDAAQSGAVISGGPEAHGAQVLSDTVEESQYNSMKESDSKAGVASKIENTSPDQETGSAAESPEKTVELVVLGVGSIADSEVSRCQISLALLLKKIFSSIKEVLVYDPVLSTMECSTLTTLGCTPISQDEEGRRRALMPTIFYMPHCGIGLYNNLLQENADPWCLGWVSVLGNSFEKYHDAWSRSPKVSGPQPDTLLKLQRHSKEYSVDPVSFPLMSAFNDMSWHLFPFEKLL